jgi:hypothetical protein
MIVDNNNIIETHSNILKQNLIDNNPEAAQINKKKKKQN